jgi:glycerol kinase
MRIASIDQGTTSTRALIVNTDGKLEIAPLIEHKPHIHDPSFNPL